MYVHYHETRYTSWYDKTSKRYVLFLWTSVVKYRGIWIGEFILLRLTFEELSFIVELSKSFSRQRVGHLGLWGIRATVSPRATPYNSTDNAVGFN